MKPVTRRNFLLQAGALGASIPSLASIGGARWSGALGGDGSALVCIYLRGGADWLNMVVPFKDKNYQAVRPTLALGEDDGVIAIDRKWALHPALTPLAELYKQKRFAPVVCVGSPHTTRSHFDAQDFMEFGAPGNRTVRSGWLNRYLGRSSTAESSEFRAMALQELLPRSLRGEYPVLAVPSGLDRKKGSSTLDRFEEFYGDGMPAGGEMEGERTEDNDPAGIVRSGRVTIETLRRYQEIVTKSKSEVEYPKSRFGAGMQNIAKVLKAGEGMEVAGLDYTGWDHHAGQGGAEGRQANMLRDLAGSIASFGKDLGPRLDQTSIIVMTEFGRTVRENGNNGTDHGHGSGVFVIGGGVKGGEVHGSWPGLKDDDLYEGRDLQVTTDFRDVFHSVLESTFSFKVKKGFFPDYASRKVSGLY